jgi:eukaryotic-like serine/threonine-protein kinase
LNDAMTDVHPLEETEPAESLVMRGQKQLMQTWAARRILPENVVVRKGTVVPRSHGARPDAPFGNSLPLPRLLADDGSTGGPQFRVGEVLGAGGMGVVRAAEQLSLAREVAVKGLRDDIDDPDVEAQLLREARVTGALEHPNIVPVHLIGRDERDKPIIAMKRIEGTSWADALAGRPFAGDPEGLARQLGVLVQVTRALSFAHARGVLHRDLKPENVMIGEFGEVYVVDWGIALALRPGAVRGLPLASDVAEIGGTPAYMAPEMAAVDGSNMTVRTDVYLLGAVLYEILTGTPPHAGEKIRDVLMNAFISKPPAFAPDVPPALAALCLRAMSPEPRARPPSADAFREEIERFLLHRSSTAVSDAATKRLHTLRDAVKRALGKGNAASTTDSPSVRQAIYGTFSECRFAFGHALEVWPGNEAARRGKQQALELMIDFELSRGSAGAAAAHLAELDAPPPALKARVEEAQRASLERRTRLATLERDTDVTAGDRVRGKLMFIAGAGWGGANLAGALINRVHPVGPNEFLLIILVPTVLVSAAAMFYWREIAFNEVNRRLWISIAWSWGMYGLMWPIAGYSHMSMFHAVGVGVYASVLFWGALTITLDRELFPIPLAGAIGFAGLLFTPINGMWWVGAAALFGCFATGALWLRRARSSSATKKPSPDSSTSP